jgi:Protein of unknown function (DUF1566)
MRWRTYAALACLLACGDDVPTAPEPDSVGVDAGRPGGRLAPSPSMDAALPLLDAIVLPPADAMPDAVLTLPPETLRACPVENACPLPAYPCVPSDDDAGYSCRGQYAAWPMPDVDPGARFAPSYSIDADRDVVLDQVTGLLWQRSLPDTYPGCTGYVETALGDACSLDEARRYCEQLTLAGERWRVPTKIELESLLRVAADQAGDPFIDVTAFPATPLGYFWTSSPGLHPAVGGKYFAVSSGNAITEPFAAEISLHVRCVHSVRSPNAPPQGHIQIDVQKKTLSDAYTRLSWLFSYIRTPVESGDRAREICEDLAGNYRLPSYKELLTLADVTRTDFAIAPELWGAPNPSYGVWSSSRTAFDVMAYSPLAGGGVGASYFTGHVSTVCVR